MEPDNTPELTNTQKNTDNLNIVTPFSKYLALILFITLPFIGGWIGYSLASVEIIEIEKVIEVEKMIETEVKNDSTININLPTKLEGEPDENTHDFIKYLYHDGTRPFLFAKPSFKSVIREHGQCEPFDGGLYKYDEEKESYILLSSIFIDKGNQPCILTFLGNQGSKYYFSESFGDQQLFIVDINQEIPSLTPLKYSHLFTNEYNGPSTNPENILLVQAFNEKTLSVFDMNTGKSKVIFDDPNYRFIALGLGMSVQTKKFTNEEIEIAVIPYGEPDKTGERVLLSNQVEYITISLK